MDVDLCFFVKWGVFFGKWFKYCFCCRNRFLPLNPLKGTFVSPKLEMMGLNGQFQFYPLV